MAVTIPTIRVNERTSLTVTFTLLDNANAPVPLVALDIAELTLYDMDTYVPWQSPVVGIINDRNAQNIINANRVTIHATSGLVTWAMEPEDNIIVTSRRQIERHRSEFRFVTSGGVELNYYLKLEVLNLRKAA